MPIYKNEKNNSWYIRMYVKDENGNSKQITRNNKSWIGRKGKELAQQEEIRLKNKFYEKPKDVPTFLQLSKKYFEDYKLRNKRSSYIKAINRFELHIKNDYPNKKINLLTKEDHNYWKKTIDNRFKSNGEPLSTKYKNILHSLVVAIFNYGIENYNIQFNPASATRRFKRKEGEIKKEIEYWDLDDFMQLESHTDKTVYKALFSCFFLLGLRRGEALSMKWNVGLKLIQSKELYVSTNVVQNLDGVLYEITTPKNETSNRHLKVPEMVSNELLKLYEEESKKEGFNLNWFVFGGEKPIPKTTVDNNLRKYTKKANLNYLSPHKLRHSFGSYLLQNSNGEITIADISKFLGHSNIEITMNTYLHTLKKDQGKISDFWNKIL